MYCKQVVVLCIGAEGSAWSPTAANQAPHQPQAGYSPGAYQGEQGYSPSHHPASAAEEAGYGADQGYTYTGAGQAGAGLPNRSNQTDRYRHQAMPLHSVLPLSVCQHSGA